MAPRAKATQALRDAAPGAPVQAPEEWLRKIRELQAAGKVEEARHELLAFRRAYPDFVLPSEFAPLLR
jgi:hypothetical protein